MTAGAPKRAATQRVGQTRDTTPTYDGDKALSALRALPSIGPRLAEKLLLLGVRSPDDLRGHDPEALYDELRAQLGPVDRCVLYAFRCAVHAAEHAADDGRTQGGGHGAANPELAKWWNWKDGGPALRRREAGLKQPRPQAAAGSRRTSIASR